jgi:hypothetical protein
MKVWSAISAAVVFGSLAVSSASANADFVQGHETLGGFQARQALARTEMSQAAAARYFDFDVLITLGALSIASGAFVAAGIAGVRRRAAGASDVAHEGWREEVMQALEADLSQYTMGLRQAA